MKKAFTLAEIVMIIGMIGVITEMIFPQIKQKYYMASNSHVKIENNKNLCKNFLLKYFTHNQKNENLHSY